MARTEFRPGTVFCAPELLRKGVGVSPVNGGPGGNELEPEGPCPDGDVSLPRRRFASFAAAGKGGRPAGRNPSHGTKPFRKTAGGAETRPHNISGRSPQNGTTGGASPSPTGKRKTSRRGGTGAQCAPLRRFQGLHRSQRDEAHPSSSRPRARPVWSPSRNPWTA